MIKQLQFFVTGCQRSGTRFYAQHLAKINHISFIDEEEFNVYNYSRLTEYLHRLKIKHFAIHAPALSHKIDNFRADFPDANLIWMYRDVTESIISMQKISWEKSSAQIEYDALYDIFISKLTSEESTKVFDDFSTILHKVIYMKYFIGRAYLAEGKIDSLQPMKALEGLEGFKKSSFRI